MKNCLLCKGSAFYVEIFKLNAGYKNQGHIKLSRSEQMGKYDSEFFLFSPIFHSYQWGQVSVGYPPNESKPIIVMIGRRSKCLLFMVGKNIYRKCRVFH